MALEITTSPRLTLDTGTEAGGGFPALSWCPDSGIGYGYQARAGHSAGQALGDREREKRRTGPLRRAHPQPPPPRFPHASRHPLRGVGSDNMIPAPVRSVPQTDRWCLQLLTIMQRGCDTFNPLVAARPVRARVL